MVSDLFDVVAEFCREMVDRGRVNEANRLNEDRPARQVVKSSRWLLQLSWGSPTRKEAVHLYEMLWANQFLLMVVYPLRDELNRLRRFLRQVWAVKRWL